MQSNGIGQFWEGGGAIPPRPATAAIPGGSVASLASSAVSSASLVTIDPVSQVACVTASEKTGKVRQGLSFPITGSGLTPDVGVGGQASSPALFSSRQAP
jgi:hypothetical protein